MPYTDMDFIIGLCGIFVGAIGTWWTTTHNPRRTERSLLNYMFYVEEKITNNLAFMEGAISDDISRNFYISSYLFDYISTEPFTVERIDCLNNEAAQLAYSIKSNIETAINTISDTEDVINKTPDILSNPQKSELLITRTQNITKKAELILWMMNSSIVHEYIPMPDKYLDRKKELGWFKADKNAVEIPDISERLNLHPGSERNNGSPD